MRLEIARNSKRRVSLSPLWTEAEGVSASVELSWSDGKLFASWTVREPELRRRATKANDKVWEDSCVEIFLKRMDDEAYRNFEFSAAAHALVGRGTERRGRTLFPSELVDSIPLSVVVLENSPSLSLWTLSAEIDLRSFGLLKEGESLGGMEMRGNIYCCGDKLKRPHFLSYAPIDSPFPDFHRKDAFVPFLFV